MKSVVKQIDPAEIDDNDLYQILCEIYVDGGFTDADEASGLFNPKGVKERGTLFLALDTEYNKVVGLVIVVSGGARAARIAEVGEAEIQLLGVRAAYRGQGIGKLLMDEALSYAKKQGANRIVLWTQESMKAAQALYLRMGFTFLDTILKQGRSFLLFEKVF